MTGFWRAAEDVVVFVGGVKGILARVADGDEAEGSESALAGRHGLALFGVVGLVVIVVMLDLADVVGAGATIAG